MRQGDDRSGVLRVHAGTAGADPAGFEAGRDLALTVQPEHGLDLPDGVAVTDHLGDDDRWALHLRSSELTTDALAAMDDALTVDGVRLAWLWELDVAQAIATALCQAVALRRAVERHRPDALVVAGPDPRARRVAAVVARHAGIALRETAGASPATVRAAGAPVGVRRRAVGAVRAAGLPSLLRRDSVVFASYWPLLPLLDRMLRDPGRRPAVMVQRAPEGPMRSVRAALRGGWVGAPGPVTRRRGRRAAAAAMARAAAAEAPRLTHDGLDVGGVVREDVLSVARRRAADDVATAASLRRALRRARPSAVLAAWDGEASGRLLVSVAREAGIRTLVLSHGAYVLPQAVVDMEVCDEPLVWSEAVAPPLTPRGRTVHVVGYPVPHAAPPPTRRRPPSPPRVLVLSQPPLRGFALDEARITMRQYTTAIRAVRRHVPDAEIVLRPHLSEGPRAAPRAIELCDAAGAGIEVDASSPIGDLHARCDLCIGTATTASLQAVLAGTPLIALNLLGFPWSWPLGGRTTVPVAHGAGELGTWLARWDAGEPLPGREDLLAALGADPAGADPTDRLLAVLDGAA